MSYRKLQYVKAIADGGGENDKKPIVKTTVIKAPDRYAAWGALGKDAADKGWIPESWDGDTTVYKNGYDNNFNTVNIPNQQQKGRIIVTGNNKTGMMNVVIRKEDGTIDRTLLQNASPEMVDAYFRSKVSTLQNRTDKLIAANK